MSRVSTDFLGGGIRQDWGSGAVGGTKKDRMTRRFDIVWIKRLCLPNMANERLKHDAAVFSFHLDSFLEVCAVCYQPLPHIRLIELADHRTTTC